MLLKNAFNFLDLWKIKIGNINWAKNNYQLQGVSINDWENFPKDLKTDPNSANLSIHKIHSYTKTNTIKNTDQLTKTFLYPNSKS